MSKTATKNYHFSVVIGKDKEGFFALCPELQGCYTQGESYEKTFRNIKSAISLHLKDRLKSGEEIPQPETVSLTSLEIAL